MSDLELPSEWRAIESAGGPLLLPEAALPLWTGVAGTDYARACSVDGYLGTLAVGRDEALVIGDEPASMALVPTRSGDSLVVAKWTYGPDQASVVSSLGGVRLDRFPAAEAEFSFGSSPQRLFDSGVAGWEAGEWLPSSLPPGRYAASTLMFEPTPEISLVLHWVRPAGAVA